MRLRSFAQARFAVLGCALVAFGCAHSPPPAAPPFKPVTTVLELMESVIAHAAEVYWQAVQVTVDETGVHERNPQTDEEWESVWAAGLAIAESGNLLMMESRARDADEWMRRVAWRRDGLPSSERPPMRTIPCRRD